MSMLIKRTVSMIMVILMVLSLAPASLAESIRRGGEDPTPASVTTDEGVTSADGQSEGGKPAADATPVPAQPPFATVKVTFDAVVTVFEKDATGFVEIGTKQAFILAAPGTYYYSVAGSDAKISFSLNGDKDTKHITTTPAESNAELTETGDQINDQTGDQINDQTGDQINDQTGDQNGDQINDDQTGDQINDQTGDQINDQTGDQNGDQINDDQTGDPERRSDQ